MKKFLGFIGAMVCIFFGMSEVHAANIYISSEGNDATGTGTESLPYATIGKALAEVKNGDNIILSTNVTHTTTIYKSATENKTFTIDLNGNTLKTAALTNDGNITVIDSGTVKGKFEMTAVFYNYGAFTLNSVKFETARYIDNKANATLTIKASELNSTYSSIIKNNTNGVITEISDSKLLLNSVSSLSTIIDNNGIINIIKGTTKFYYKNASMPLFYFYRSSATAYTSSKGKVVFEQGKDFGVEKTDGEFKYRELETLETNVCKIGSINYKSLNNAISASKSGDTIALLADVTYETPLAVYENENVSIDLAGHDLDISSYDTINGGMITFTDTGSTKGKISALYIENNGTLNLNGVKLELIEYIKNKGIMTVKSSNVKTTKNSTILGVAISNWKDGVIKDISDSTLISTYYASMENDGVIEKISGTTKFYYAASYAPFASGSTGDTIFEFAKGLSVEKTDGELIYKDLVTLTEDVCEIGSTKYKTIVDAVMSAKDSDTIKLIKNINLNSGFTIPADLKVTLNLSGHTINTDVYKITNRGNLTIIDSGETKGKILGNVTGILINCGNLTLNGVNIETTKNIGITNAPGAIIDSIVGSTIKSIQYGISNNSNESVSARIMSIKNSTIESGKHAIYNQGHDGGTNNDAYPSVIYELAEGVTLKYTTKAIGGTDASSYELKDGYVLSEGATEATTVAGTSTYVAQIDGKKFNSLVTAFAYANEFKDKSTIKLLTDVEMPTILFVNKNKTVTLDLNGFTLSAGVSYVFKVRGNFTLTDSSEAQTGKIKDIYLINRGMGTFNMKGGTIETIANKDEVISNMGDFNYYKGKIEKADINSIGNDGTFNNYGTVTIGNTENGLLISSTDINNYGTVILPASSRVKFSETSSGSIIKGINDTLGIVSRKNVTYTTGSDGKLILANGDIYEVIPTVENKAKDLTTEETKLANEILDGLKGESTITGLIDAIKQSENLDDTKVYFTKLDIKIENIEIAKDGSLNLVFSVDPLLAESGKDFNVINSLKSPSENDKVIEFKLPIPKEYTGTQANVTHKDKDGKILSTKKYTIHEDGNAEKYILIATTEFSTFEVSLDVPKEPINPKTGDSISLYMIIGLMSFLGISVVLKKKVLS